MRRATAGVAGEGGEAGSCAGRTGGGAGGGGGEGGGEGCSGTCAADELGGAATGVGGGAGAAHEQEGLLRRAPQQARQPKPYQAQVNRGGKNVYLGSFATAEEAALCVARPPEWQAKAAAAPPLTRKEVPQRNIWHGAFHT